MSYVSLDGDSLVVRSGLDYADVISYFLACGMLDKTWIFGTNRGIDFEPTGEITVEMRVPAVPVRWLAEAVKLAESIGKELVFEYDWTSPRTDGRYVLHDLLSEA
jgi:hypothetical protein